MSRCISRDGEYSEHTLGEAGDRFTCQRCFVFDEDAAMAELAARDAVIEQIRALAETFAVWESTRIVTYESDQVFEAGKEVATHQAAEEVQRLLSSLPSTGETK